MISLNVPPGSFLKVSEAEFTKLASANRDLRLERKDNGELIIMPPTGSNTGRKNSNIISQLVIWNKINKNGIVFDSLTGFRLPKGSILSPDASWVEKSRWKALTQQERDSFAPICPEFIIELRSPTERLKNLQNKMSEYLSSGLILGWLIDAIDNKVEIYRTGKQVEILDKPSNLSGENVLLGFNLDLSEIW